MSRRWRLALLLALAAGLAGLSFHQYLRLQAALPPPLQSDPRQAEYVALKRLAGELSRPMQLSDPHSAELQAFRARQHTLAKLRAYALGSPFRSELMLVAPTPAWTEGWISGPQASRLHEGLSGEPTWILPVHNGERWSLQVRSLVDPAMAREAQALHRHLAALILSCAATALVLGFAWGRQTGRTRRARQSSVSELRWERMRTDLGPLDDAVSDHMRLRTELARQSESLAAVTEAVRQRREQRRREGQPA